jgi:hypothetical protein
MNVLLLALFLFGLACTIVGPSPTASAVFGFSSSVRPPLAEPAHVAVNAPDRSLIDKLEHLMTAEAVHRDPQVALTSLARRLGVSEKRMREVINDSVTRTSPASSMHSDWRRCGDALAIHATIIFPFLRLPRTIAHELAHKFAGAVLRRHGLIASCARWTGDLTL